MRNTETVKPAKYLVLARILAERGARLFSTTEAKLAAEENALETIDIKAAIAALKYHGWAHHIRRDLYGLDSIFLSGNPIHELEIATRLVKPSVISHLSAFHHHGLTDQIPQIVFATTITGSSLPRLYDGKYFIHMGVRYCYTQIKSEHFFGSENIWIGESQIPITDMERTLVDGLIKPKYCGGIIEVLEAFKNNTQHYNISKLVEYALKLDTSIAKRLGWVLENIGIENHQLDKLADKPFSGFIKLDPSGKNDGFYDKRWQVRVNL